MSLTDQECVAIAEWFGWTRIEMRPSPFGEAYPIGRVPGARPPFDAMEIIPDFAANPSKYMPLFERLAKEGRHELSFDVAWFCTNGDDNAIGRGETPGESVCRAVLAVIAAEKAAATLSSTKSKDKA